ncbi:MAG: flagellar hook-basal body complex protein [Candidatus Sericytochromatia bacterium]
MGRGDFGFDGLYSLNAVNSWIAVINSNLNASSRTGYKATKVKFRGGVTEVVRRPFGPLLGIQMPETTLQIDQTSIDFSQGSIIASTEPTHLAIQGDGFFALSTTNNAAGNVVSYYTRDGEFHVINDAGTLRLVHSSGLYLVDAQSGDAMEFDAQNDLVRLDDGAAGFTGAVINETHLQGFNAPNFLRFSRFGSTVFEVTGNAGDVGDYTVTAGAARIVAASLESSNSSLSQTLPELSLAQKFFSAVSKVISVHQTNLDTVINLIR